MLGRWTAHSIVLLLLLVGFGGPLLQAGQEQTTPSEIYERFRAWVNQQPRSLSGEEIEDRYRAVLAGEGLGPAEVDRRVSIIVEQGARLEVDRWNRILTAPEPTFNTKPNGFLVAMTQGSQPGRALDVGMGQGRNSLYLAQQGWQVTGFDPAEQAVAAAQSEARRLGLKIDARVQSDRQFDFGTDQWDLVVLSYVTLRHLVPTIHRSLKPGGLVIAEAFHRDATREGPIGAGVVYDSNELPRLFDQFRIVRYEDTEGVGDFGLRKTRLVRLCAQKP